MVLQYAEGGNFNDWINYNYKYFTWKEKMLALINIINNLQVPLINFSTTLNLNVETLF